MPNRISAVAEAVAPILAPEDWPEVDNLVTEDDTPVDNLFSAKQQRLFIEPLYTSWAGPGEGRSFLADANVGVFYSVREPPLVPDAFLSLDVQAPADPWPKRNRSYFVWEYGKPPDVVVEVVSNRVGEEIGRKKRLYARIGVKYYVIFDPQDQLRQGRVVAYELRTGVYVPTNPLWLAEVGLGLRLWQGVYEDMDEEWLRWCDGDGIVLPIGAERAVQAEQHAAQAAQRAEQAAQRAEQAAQRAEQAEQRAAQLAAKLRELGLDPDQI